MMAYDQGKRRRTYPLPDHAAHARNGREHRRATTEATGMGDEVNGDRETKIRHRSRQNAETSTRH